jgi:hypothetical protein
MEARHEISSPVDADRKATPIADAIAEGRQAYRDGQYDALTPQFLAWVVGWALERESIA